MTKGKKNTARAAKLSHEKAHNERSQKNPDRAITIRPVELEGPFLVLDIDENRLRRYVLTFDYGEVSEILRHPDGKKPSDIVQDIQSDPAGASDGRSQFAVFLERFSEQIKGFYHLVHITMVVRSNMRRNFITSRVIDFAETDLESIENEGRIRVFRIPNEKYSDTIKRVRELGEFLEGTSQLPSLLLMGLVARYDAQISSLVRLLLKDRPEAIGSRQSEFDLATVLTFSNIDDLKDLFIDQEVHKLMLSSHHDQVLFIEKTFKIEIREKLPSYLQFLEIFERRNLIAHGEGYVNTRYDAKCNSYKIPNEKRLDLNSEVELSPRYLFESIDTILAFGLITIWSLWTKRHKEEINTAYSTMIDITFDLMLEKRYRLVSQVLCFLLDNTLKGADDVQMRMFAVNLAICEKELGNKDWKSNIDRFQWGACTTNFQICIAAICEDVERVCDLLPTACSEALPQEVRITAANLRDWPAFRWIRDDKKFQAKFREVFGQEIRPDVEADISLATDNISSHQKTSVH